MRPCVRAIQASTGLVSPSSTDVVSSFSELTHIRESPPGLTTTTWLLCHLVNGSARKPTKDVPSCDTLQGAARRRRTGDFRMGIPTAIASRNGERRELKHLSIGRKRKRNAMSSVTAGERDTAQTEGPTTDVVYGLTCSIRPVSRSLLERSAKQGESPVRTPSTMCVSSGVAGVGNPS